MQEKTAVASAPAGPAGHGTKRLAAALWRFVRKKPLGAFGLLVLAVYLFLAFLAPLVSPFDPLKLSSRAILLSPGADHWFGTDRLGRDILSRTIYGARVSIYVGLAATLSASIVGSVIGVTSAYFGGWYDLIIQRFVDGLTAFPTLLLALALMAALGTSFNNVILAEAVVFTPRVVRVLRSVSLSIKEMPYIEAAKASGASNTRTMARHVFPNTFASLMVMCTSLLGTAILIEASLSFLGVGMPASIISWGSMLNSNELENFASAPWVGIFPGMALTLLVFGVNVLGDALRDVLDPRMRGQ